MATAGSAMLVKQNEKGALDKQQAGFFKVKQAKATYRNSYVHFIAFLDLFLIDLPGGG